MTATSVEFKFSESRRMAHEVLNVRVLSEEQVRMLLRGHAPRLSSRLPNAITVGDAEKEPVYHGLCALTEDLCLMRCMVAEGAGLTPTQLDEISDDLLFNACSEIAMVARRHHGDQRLKEVFIEELAAFFPTFGSGDI